ncbi:MAG: cyclic nucleotide-binding domain-containing protein [Nitrospinae bacterium]|nr:cyclic nucleotide-binding domain-containing protein [Nitrospinota bacterium]
MRCHSKLTGKNLMINRAAESLFSGQVDSLIMLIIVIFLIMSFLFTSPMAGLISLVPNLIPVVFCFGVMGLFGIPLNPGTATVAAIAVGIAIDDTIHLMTRYGEICRVEPDQFKSSILTIRGEAVPVISTSISLACGFATLLLSGFNIVFQFGVLAASTMIFALFSDLLVSPLLLRFVRLVGMWDIVAMKINKDVLINSPLFKGMSIYQIKKAILLSQLHEFKNQEIVIRQGEKTGKMYLVLSGKIDIVRENGDKEIKIQTMNPGEFFGEVAFAGEIERIATARAIEYSEVISLDSDSIEKSLRFYPRIGKKLFENICRILSLRLAQTSERLSQ